MTSFRSVQIETSALCNLRCEMCPTLNYKTGFGIMSKEVFNKFISDIDHLDSIALEGWGEPLLDGLIFDRVAKAKTKATSVSFSTNATLLTQENIQRLMDCGLNGLNVSMDGGTKDVYENIRKGANFNNVLDAIKTVKNSGIALSLTFVITKNNFFDIPNFIDLANEVGVSQLTFKPNDVVSSKENYKSCLSEKELVRVCKQAEKYAESMKYGVKLCFWNIFPESIARNSCWAGPLWQVFINYLGDLTPCCNLGHFAPRYEKKMIGYKRFDDGFISFGNILRENIYAIWNKREYVEFRANLSQKNWPKECHLCNLR